MRISLSNLFSFGKSQPVTNVANPTVAPMAPSKKDDPKKRLHQKIRSQHSYSVDLGLDKWKTALEMAEWPDNPDFRDYYQIIRQVLKKDGRLRAQIKIAINKVLDEPWAIIDIKTKEIDKEATELMSSKMFYDILRTSIEAELWGTRVIELKEPIKTDNGWEVSGIYTINQSNLNPGLGRIYLGPEDSEGIPYREDPWNTYLIEAGDRDDLGLFEVATYLAIIKNFSLLDWSRSGEKFMDPIIGLRTDSDNEDELRNKEDYLKGVGKNSYFITDKDDEIEFLERNGTTAYKLVSDLAAFLNTEIAESINAQAAATEAKSFVGSAEVQERILDSFTTSRMRNMTFWVNDVVIPKLMTIDNGMYVYAKALKGKKFMPLQLMKELKDPNLVEPGIDPNGDPNNPAPGKPTPPNAGAKKKPSPSNWQRFDPIAGGF